MNLSEATDDELRAEVRRRGMEMHSVVFSEAAQKLLRDIPPMRSRLDAMETAMTRAACHDLTAEAQRLGLDP